MLHKTETLKGYKLQGLDGELGMVEDFYFDDQHWTLRYLVVNTVQWLPGRKVLISPYAVGAVNKEEGTLSVQLTKKQIEGSPSVDTDKPVSRQYEKSYYGYYGWPLYWGGAFAWGPYDTLLRDGPHQGETLPRGEDSDPHLRSAYVVSGFFIQAKDGEIGHVEDFIIDDETWSIRYLAIETRNWWPGKHVLVSPKWIESVSWTDSKVVVGLSREEIRKSPAYRAESLLTRDYEAGLHDHYNRQGYWVGEVRQGR